MTTTSTLDTIVGIDLELPQLAVQAAGKQPGDLAGPQHDQIAQAAYFIAQSRGFAPGADLDDWLAAEQQIAQGHGA